MNIIFQINGGLGKSVMATAVCKSIKVKYPDSKLIVITGYPDVFLNNPNVDRCLRLSELKYFYNDYIKDQDFLVFNQEPYQTTSYIKKEKGLIEIWCELLDVPYVRDRGEIFLTKREVDFYLKKHQFNKPIMILQTSGAAGEIMYNWTRDIPPSVVKSIVDKYSQTYEILHIKNESQIKYPGTTPFTDNIRAVMVMITQSKKRVLMDSCCQHIAAALELPSDVLWVATEPEVFGYQMHNNILSQPETKFVSLPNAYLTKYDFVAEPSQFPYNNESEIFDAEVINQI